MMSRTGWHNKRIHVIGMGRTGMAVARVMPALGAKVALHDSKPAGELAEAIREAASLELPVFAGEAAYRGIYEADLIVPSPGVPCKHPVLREAVRRGVEVLSEIEIAWRISPAPILAVTGTNGKTTTTVALYHMLEADGQKAVVAGNISAGEIKKALIAAAYEADSQTWIAAEISTFQLEWVRGFRPKVGALLNITEDHLDRHPSFEAYAALKARLFAFQTEEDVAILNADSPMAQQVAGAVCARKAGFSRTRPLEAGCFLRGGTVCARWEGSEFPLFDAREVLLPGAHNLENLMAAAAMAVACGVRPEAVVETARTFRGVVHRLEAVAEIGGVRYINNSMCTNPAAGQRSLEAFEDPVLLIAGGKDKAMDFGPMAEVIARRAKKLFLIGETAPVIEEAVRAFGFDRIERPGSLQEAVRKAHGEAQPGDIVLLSPGCASFDMFSGFEARGNAFKEAVRELRQEETT
ncbi:MAG: UDP-N-acetylmuramoyl-L-alanine--D-glutamate ligase [Armatimonadetes bacterium]|nr:UDP-N-acetylmuramoyl-L-alanine--D-glutamate ligase [Armatimonadota bacterium]